MEKKFLVFLVACVTVVSVQAWSGHIVPYGRWSVSQCRRCICQYPTYCGYWRWYRCTVWITDYRCQTGWRHNGDQNCNIPICYPGCNTGRCTAPNTCVCPPTVKGQFCQTLVCSHQIPCYPGNCYENDKCNCTQGFVSQPTSAGCLKMEESQKAYIGRSTAIISHLRNTDNALLYYFLSDGTDEDVSMTTVWIDQRIFNYLSFEFEAKYNQPEEIADKPIYVNDLQLGITYGDIRLQVTDFEGKTMDRSKYEQACPGTQSSFDPVTTVFNCTVNNLRFKTLIEDADTLTVTFRVRSGGFRRMINLISNQFIDREELTQVEATKQIHFKFDFRPPKYCSEPNATHTCTSTSTILSVANEFTKDPITLRWEGWRDTDYGSGLWYYYLELHPLVVKDARKTLTEMSPIAPVYSITVMHNATAREYTHNITPLDPGMYSVLMEVRDIANNSRLARRFVLYDPDSEITLDTSGGKSLHVSSAAKETGYIWQAATNQDNEGMTRFDVNWKDYFVNKLHENGAYLNEIQKFPVQFQDITDDVLMVQKFVDPYLDDHEGKRTNASISNLRAIVKFEYAFDKSRDAPEPSSGWVDVPGPNDRVSFEEKLQTGQSITVWVRGYDVMGNKKAVSTVVTLDYTNPRIDASSVTLNLNDDSTNNTFDSSIEFDVEEPQSGVHEIEMNIVMYTPGEGKKKRTYNHKTKANYELRNADGNQQNCMETSDPLHCFRRHQKVQVDHCWFMLPDKDDLAVSNATIDVTVYNQAMLTDTTRLGIERLSALSGLETFSGPQNVSIVQKKHDSFRIAWVRPNQMSCYGRADINIVIQYMVGGKQEKREHRVSSDSTYFDVGGVPPSTNFIILFSSTLGGGGLTLPETYSAQTSPPPEDEGGVSGALIGGVAAGVVVLVILIVVLFVFLIRRGYIKPQEKVRQVRRAATRVYRERVAHSVFRPKSHSNKTYYDNRQSELYIYGEMDMEGPQIWHLDRNDISLEAQIKSGNFANIYRATLRSGQRAGEVVVAKTLKENYTQNDEMLMRAKTNFFGSAVGDHPNVLKFIGAVVSDPTLGPFMIYEHCENGTLKEYLVSHRSDMSIEMQENLFRFGLDIAKGMEYLAGKDIVHRRLAARNILLTFLNEIKISGFGPQPADEEVVPDAEQGKRERIPIKWMAPECMASTKDATEKSDVWSYAVVLWEIFSMGETPFSNVRSKDLATRIKKGTRLPKPEQCDDTWYDVMSRCWQYGPEKRPDFSDIRMELDNLFESAPGDDYYYYKR